MQKSQTLIDLESEKELLQNKPIAVEKKIKAEQANILKREEYTKLKHRFKEIDNTYDR